VGKKTDMCRKAYGKGRGSMKNLVTTEKKRKKRPAVSRKLRNPEREGASRTFKKKKASPSDRQKGTACSETKGGGGLKEKAHRRGKKMPPRLNKKKGKNAP